MPSRTRARIDWDAISQRLSEDCDRWRACFRSTGPIDRVAATEAISSLYRLMRREDPIIVWCDSPWQAAAIRAVLLLELSAKSFAAKHVKECLRSGTDFPWLWHAMWKRLI